MRLELRDGRFLQACQILIRISLYVREFCLLVVIKLKRMPMNMSVLTGAIITHAIEVTTTIIKSLTVYNWKNDTSTFPE